MDSHSFIIDAKLRLKDQILRPIIMFYRFCSVGAAGFVVDVLIFTALFSVLQHTDIARVLAFWCAATFVWWGNRQLTFNDHSAKLAQWWRAFIQAHIGGAVNLLCFYWLSQVSNLPIAFVGGGVSWTCD